MASGLPALEIAPSYTFIKGDDITIIGKPTPAGTAFVKYTLSPAGLAQYKQGGFTVLTPTLFGSKSDVPASVASELGS